MRRTAALQMIPQVVLRIAKVYCNQQPDLCARFGAGDSDDSPGYPYILWFKGRKEVEPYSGERTLEGLTAWVAEKQGEGAL